MNHPALDQLAEFVAGCERLLVLTGAGCSTESGVPDYRDANGEWKHTAPIQFRDFVGSQHARRRYWARSMTGWPRFGQAQPNAAHRALVLLETAGRIGRLITQNVDRLHQLAGSRRVLDLHGRLDRVRCTDCSQSSTRDALQERLRDANPEWHEGVATPRPDGDVDLAGVDYDQFRVPACEACGGVLKPDVVFFGEAIPKHVGAQAQRWLEDADGLLVVGSSLMVYSGYRFARFAARNSLPLAAVNIGRTRADELIDIKVEARAGDVLPVLVNM